MEIISQESSNLDFSGTFSFESLDPQILSQGFKKVREYLLKWSFFFQINQNWSFFSKGTW